MGRSSRGMAPRLSLKARALEWLAQREQSRVELRRKLLRLARAEELLAAKAGECGGGDVGESAADSRRVDRASLTRALPDGAGARATAPDGCAHLAIAAETVEAAKAREAPEAREPPEAVDDVDGTPTAADRVEALLDWLESNRYLSPERFIESRVHARASRFGNLRIRQELKEHGLALPVEAVDALRASELDRAQAVWARKFGTSASTATEQARQMRFLIGRGFSAEVVRRVVREPRQTDE